MRNLFIAVELIDKQVRAILAERINGKIKVHGVENEELSVSAVDDNGVLINHSIFSSALSSIVKKMENRAVTLFDNNQVKKKKIFLALSCFPCTTFEETHTFSLNINQTINEELIDALLNSIPPIEIPNKVVKRIEDISYTIDGVEYFDVQNRKGTTLDVKSLMLSYPKDMDVNLDKTMERCSFDVESHFSPIVESRVYQYPLIDDNANAFVAIHNSKSYVVVYNKSKLIHCSVIPFGWNDVFNDLKYFMLNDDKVKQSENSSIINQISCNSLISNVLKAQKHEILKVGREFSFEVQKLYDVIFARINEILSFVNNELEQVKSNIDKDITIGIVSNIFQDDICDYSTNFFGTSCYSLQINKSLLESIDNFSDNMATLIGWSMEVDKSSFEVIEKEKEDKTKEEEEPFESAKKETKKKSGFLGSLKGKISNIEQTLFTGNNDENND